jgi:predicted DNA-binding protein
MPGVSKVTKTISFRLPHSYINDLNKLAKRKGTDRSALIKEALEAQFGSELAEIIVSEPSSKSPDI